MPDAVLVAQSRLDALAADVLGGTATGGTAVALRRSLDRLGSLLDIQRGLPDLAGSASNGEGRARERLTTLRAAAADLAVGLAADPSVTGPARRWGLPDEGALEVLRRACPPPVTR